MRLSFLRWGKMRVTFLGLGKMGAAMASNVRKAGYDLTVWNRSPEKAEGLVRAGARLAPDPRAAVRQADIVISSLADDASVEAVVLGADGILSQLRKGAIHVGTSTIAPALAERLAQAHATFGAQYVSAPVLGRVPAAEAGELTTFLAGDAGAVAAARPVISSYAPAIITVGEDPRHASSAKLVANFLGVAAMDLIGQSMAMGERCGLSPDVLRMMLFGLFGAEATRDYIQKIAVRDFDDVGFTVTGGLKDVDLMIATAGSAGVTLSSALAIRQKLAGAISQGWANKDWSCFTDLDRRI